jgi:GNAT superfamily N-acetyltransferase
MDIVLSEIDRLRFGVITAKCAVRELHDLITLGEWCRQHQVEFVIARTKTDNLSLVQRLEDSGFRLMDTLVYFQREVVSSDLAAIAVPQGYRLDCSGRPDATEMEQTAALAFKNYIGHYHADSRLPVAQSDAVYSSWAASSAARPEIANQIVSVYSECDSGRPQLAAFATLNYKQSKCEGVLFGVHPAHRQRGLHRVLVRAAIVCAAQHGCTSIISSTQLNNVQVQRNWVREGFLPSESFYTFHQWR